ncbi:MAG TPA: hypothetical protein IAB83_04295 [Candidatus Faecousia faecavium]|nr:hypothetical protein [Candidatus Faecousia faecavium]
MAVTGTVPIRRAAALAAVALLRIGGTIAFHKKLLSGNRRDILVFSFIVCFGKNYVPLVGEKEESTLFAVSEESKKGAFCHYGEIRLGELLLFKPVGQIHRVLPESVKEPD